MLTPCFEVTQENGFIIITMRVPFAKTAEAEFCIDGTFFRFYCKPYFLRLCLPGELVEDGRERAVHDINKGTITVYVPKLHDGRHFEDLGMITSLLSKKPMAKTPQKPLIEVLPGAGAGEEAAEVEGEEEFDWQIDQQVPVKEEPKLHLDKHSWSCYGFAEQQSAVISKLQHELPALVDCPDPDHMTPQERRVARLAHEEASFNPQHYLADLMEGAEMIENLCQFQPAWSQQLAAWTDKKGGSKGKVQREPGQDIIPFTDDEKMHLKELPNKEYLLDKATQRALYLGLVDIIFAYAYDCRVTEDEHNVESAWTICKLSSTLSWLEVFRGSVEEVVYGSVRRCLCYPLYRHWQLAQCVLKDTAQLFLLGRRKLLQCLLDVRKILNSSDPYYVMNDLYITDYCVWIQRASTRQIQNLARELQQIKVERKSMGWELEELEEAAHLVAAGYSSSQDWDSTESGEASSDDDEGETGSSDSEPDTGSDGESDDSSTITAECASDANRKEATRSFDWRDSLSVGGKETMSVPASDVGKGVTAAAAAAVNQSKASCVGHTTGDDLVDSTPTAKLLVAAESEKDNTLNKEPGTAQGEGVSQTLFSPLNDSSMIGHSTDIERLSEGLCNLLTLQPATHHQAGHTHQKLIEELN